MSLGCKAQWSLTKLSAHFIVLKINFKEKTVCKYRPLFNVVRTKVYEKKCTRNVQSRFSSKYFKNLGPVLWHSSLSHCLECQHFISEPVALLPLQLLANIHGKAMEGKVQALGPLHTMWETQMKCVWVYYISLYIAYIYIYMYISSSI